MATRRWIKNLERWIDGSGSTTEAVAKRSRHKTAHVLELFADPAPNPTMRLYLELVSVAGARLKGVDDNTPAAVVAHLAALVRDKGLTLSSLARTSGVSRQQLSTLFNDADPSPTLGTIDRLVAELGAEPDFALIRAGQAVTRTEADNEADDGEADEDDDGDGEADEDEDDDGEAGAKDGEAEDGEADDEQAELDDDDADAAELDDDDDDDAAEDDADADADAELDDQAADDDAAGDDRDAVVAALQEQNTALQRRVEANEAQIAELAKPKFWQKVAKGAAGVAAGAGIAILVLKRRKE